MTETASLWALFGSSFLAASLLPVSSEAVLFAVLKSQPGILWAALAVATVGNTLGGLSSYIIGRVIPEKKEKKGPAKGLGLGLARVQRYGAPVLLLSWVPIVGDPLCLAAGWLRLNVWYCTLYIALGKFARYWVIAVLAA